MLSEKSADSILKKIPEELHRYWFLGLIDRDGCFYINTKQYLTQFSICSSYNQNWEYVINLFKKLNINIFSVSRRIQKTSKHSVIRINNKKEMKKLIDYLYPNGYEFGFKRKFEKAKDILAMI